MECPNVTKEWVPEDTTSQARQTRSPLGVVHQVYSWRSSLVEMSTFFFLCESHLNHRYNIGKASGLLNNSETQDNQMELINFLHMHLYGLIDCMFSRSTRYLSYLMSEEVWTIHVEKFTCLC